MKNNKSNRPLLRISLFILFWVLLNITPAFSAIITWTGAIDNSWEEPGNWSGGVPGSGDDARISNVSGVTTVVHSTGSTDVTALRIYSGVTFQLTGGNLTFSDLMYVASGAIFEQSNGNLDIPLATSLSNYGNYHLSGGTLNVIGYESNYGGGTFDYTGGIISGGGNIYNNSGTSIFNIPVGASIDIADIENVNNSTIYVTGESLQYSNLFKNNVNGTILGNGTIDTTGVAFLNSGSVNPGDFLMPGILTFNSYFENVKNVGDAAEPNLDIELGGTNAGTEYDQLAVTGDVDLGGTLNVTLIDLGGGVFNPGLGDTFTILTNTGTRSGIFSKTNLPGLDPYLEWKVNYNTNSVVLTVVPKWVITPEIQDYDNMNIGGVPHKETFNFTNAWPGAVTLGTATLTGTDAGEFTIITDNCSGVTLPQQLDDCNVEVSFHPTSSGLKKAEISIPVTGIPGSPFTAQLEGTGIDENNPFPGKWGHASLTRKHSGTAEVPIINWESNGGATVLYSGPNTGITDEVGNDGLGNPDSVSERTAWAATSYSSTARKDGSYILEMTDAEGSDWDRHVLSDNGNMALTDKTFESDREAISVAIRMDGNKVYSDADFSGEYYFIGYEYENGVRRSWSEVITADGSGNFDRISTRNEVTEPLTSELPLPAGTVTTENVTGQTYAVAGDGTVTYGGGDQTSYLSADGSLGLYTHPRQVSPDNPVFRFFMKKGDRSYSTADLEGKWAVAVFGDDADDGYFSGFGSLYCDSSGNCRKALHGQKEGQTRYEYNQFGQISINPDGSMEISDNPGTPSHAAAIGNNGNTFIYNDSFGINSDQRMIIIGVRAEASYNLADWPLPLMSIDTNSIYDNSINHMLHLPDGSGGFLKNNSYDSWEAGTVTENGTMVITEGIEEGPYDMTVFDIPTKNLTHVTSATTKRAAYPYVDGTQEKILFIDSTDLAPALKKMNTDGTAIELVASPTVDEAVWWFDAFWMGPYGKQIVLAERNGTGIRLVYMLVDGTGRVDLTPILSGEWYNVSWRPDGTGILFYWGFFDDGVFEKYTAIDLDNMAAFSQVDNVHDLSLTDLDQAGNIVAYTQTGNLLSLTYEELYDGSGNFLADVSAQVPLLADTFFGKDPIGQAFFADLDGTNIRPFIEPISNQITDNTYVDLDPQINNNGSVVWEGEVGITNEIFLYDGTNTTQLTTNAIEDNSPQINNNGAVVWISTDNTTFRDVYLYDGTDTTPLTSGAWARVPQINDNGIVVWGDSDGNDDEIYLYDGASIITLSDLAGVNTLMDANPQINDNGYVVWRRDDPDGEIMLYDGSTITKLTDNDTPDYSPRINDNGYVVWVGSSSEIFLYDGTTTTQLTDNTTSNEDPQINNNGYVVWQGYDGNDNEIFLYDGTAVLQLTDNNTDDDAPQINDNGYVVWRGDDGNDKEIYLYDGANILQLTDNDNLDESNQQINNSYIVWAGYDGNDMEIFRVAAPASTTTLSISKSGSGSGTVTATGIDCGINCSETYTPDTVVDLTATPDSGSVFAGWSGYTDCLDGQVTMDAARSCTATFESIESFIWSYDTGGSVNNDIIIHDIDGDGYDELLLLEVNETLRIISGADGSTELWSYQLSTANRYSRGVTTINDLDGDDIEDIIVIVGTSGNGYGENNDDDEMYAISGAVVPPGTRVIWGPIHIGCGLAAPVVLPDVNSDGFDDIFANTGSPDCTGYGDVGYHFSGADGTVFWNSDTNGIWDIYGRTVTPDLNGDNIPDIITTGAGGSVGVEAWSGGPVESLIWSTLLGTDWIRNPAVLGDMNGDGVSEIGVARFNTAPLKIIVLNGATGGTVWEYTLGNTPSTIGNLGDVNSDGIEDVVIGTYNINSVGNTDYNVYGLSGDPAVTTRVLWSYDVGVNNYVTVVPDIDGDTIKDVLVNGANSKILALSGFYGNLIHEHNFYEGATYKPQFGEFDNLPGVDYETGVGFTLYALLLDVSDSVPPVIAIQGNNPEEVLLGSVYSDAGASAVDNVDGDLTADIVTVDTVNTSVLGTYTVTYDVSDSSMNTAHAERVVNVVAPIPTTFTVTATSGVGGTISPTGNNVVNLNDSSIFTITADSGYYISDVLVDGSSVGQVSSYTFTNVTADHSISATFNMALPSTYTINASTPGGGNIDPSGTVTVADGGDQTFTFTPNAGHYIYDVLVDSVSVGQVASYTFTGVTENHTFEVVFNHPPEATDTADYMDGKIVATSSLPVSASDYSANNPETTFWRARRADMPFGGPGYDASFDMISTTPDHELFGLEAGLKYVWQVSYEYTNGSTSPWSDEYGFLVGVEKTDTSTSAPSGTGVADYIMVTFPTWPLDPSSEAVLGDDMPEGYDTIYYRFGTYDAMSGGYNEFGPDLKIVPGRAYWVLARNGLNPTVEGVPVSLMADIEVPLDYNSPNGWNMVGPPNKADYNWADVEVVAYDPDGNILYGPVAIGTLADPNPYIDIRLWRWENGTYKEDTTVMLQNQGYWVQALEPGVSLHFPVAAQLVQAGTFSPVRMIAQKINQGLFRLKLALATPEAVADAGDSPPLPMGALADSSSSPGAAGGGCFIATAAYGSYWEPHVMTLRHFRDNVLLTNTVGRYLVKQYYAYSPPMADFIAEHDSLRFATRIALTPLVYMVAYPLASLLVLLVFAAIGGGLFIRRRHEAV